MRLLTSTTVLAGILVVPAGAFVSSISRTQSGIPIHRAATETKTRALPASVTFDLPAWLVEASTTADVSTALPDTVNLISQQLALLFTSWNVDAEVAATLSTAATTAWHLEAIAAFAAGNIFLIWLNSPDKTEAAPYVPGTTTYSPEKAVEFYSKRPLLVLKRILRLALLTGAFNTGLLFDWLILGKALGDEEYTALKKAEPRRAKKALGLCEVLGPTFIKLGQALSIRTDLVPEAYALELRKLQDAVPPFDSNEARDVIKKELGVKDLSDVFSTLSEEPVASASIGQVYRGTLAYNGKDVAVKVQRPGILAEIALDLHVLRVLTPIQTILVSVVLAFAFTF